MADAAFPIAALCIEAGENFNHHLDLGPLSAARAGVDCGSFPLFTIGFASEETLDTLPAVFREIHL